MINIEKKLEFERQCIVTNKWEYDGEYRPNSYPFEPKKETINFKLLDREDYHLDCIENKFIIYVPKEHGDVKLEIKRLYL